MDSEGGALSDSTLLFLQGIICDTVERTQPKQPRRSQPADRHYPPDALRISGRDRQRRMLRALRSHLAFAQAVGPLHQTVLYRITSADNPAQNNCYHPLLLVAVRHALRTALKRGSRRGYPAMVAVETGASPCALHIHVVCGADAVLPERLSVGEWGEFVRVPYRGQPRTLNERVEYLYKAGHKGAQAFDSRRPADDPCQPPPFRRALADYRSARALAKALGMSRLPPRVFMVFVPRLTPAQVAHARTRIQQQRPRRDVRRLTATEWEAVRRWFPLGSQSKAARERLRTTINLILRAQAGPHSLRQVWLAAERQAVRKKQKHFPGKSVVYDYQRRFAPELERAVAWVQQRRTRAADPYIRLLAALNSEKISGNAE